MHAEIWVAGYPSAYGGADTELDHNIDLWRSFGVDVHLVPMFGYDPAARRLCEERGCVTHEYRPGVFRDKVVVSFCNGEFLRLLPEIREAGRPAAVVWFNCMTWPFDRELEAHRNGWVDLFGFASDYQRGLLEPALAAAGPVRVFDGYRPYFNPDNASQAIRYGYHEPDDVFAVGRVSRDDAAKYPPDMWAIFNKVCVPRQKKAFVLGYGSNAAGRCGPPPAGLDWLTWAPNAIPVREFYGRVHCLVHKTGGSRESYCRVVPEAYAAGVAVVVEDDFAFPALVEDGVTGFRCRSSDEMSFRASELAFDEPRRRRMVEAARRFLEGEVAARDKCWAPWKRLLQR
jgi:glycosyltransferase involved in cell wall biosynthesis